MATTTLSWLRRSRVWWLCCAAAVSLGCHSQSEPLDVHQVAGQDLPPARATIQETPAKTADGRGIKLEDGLDADEAVAIALLYNPSLRAARREREVAEAEVVAVTQIENPQIRLELLHIQQLRRGAWGISFQWFPPMPLEYSARKAQANARVEEVRQEIAEREWDLANQVRIAHATASEFDSQRAPTQRSIELRRKLVDAVRQRVEQGASTQIQQNLAVVSLARAEQELENIELARSTAVRVLIGLMGVMPDSTIKLQENAAAGWPDEDARTPNPKDMAGRAMDNRPLLKAASARYDQLTHAVRAEKALRWPWIRSITLPRYRDNYTSDNPNDFSGYVDVSVPIFNQNGGRIAVAEAARNRERDALVAKVEEIRRDIALACAELDDRKTALKRYREVIMPAIEEGETILAKAYEGQQADLTMLLAGQDATFRIRRDYVDARLQYRRAWLALARVVGAPPAALARGAR